MDLSLPPSFSPSLSGLVSFFLLHKGLIICFLNFYCKQLRQFYSVEVLCFSLSCGISFRPSSHSCLPHHRWHRREPGMPPAFAARISALAGRRQSPEQPPHRLALEPQSLLQDVYPPRLSGASVRLPSGFILFSGRWPLQSAPLHLPAHPSEGCLPRPVAVHPWVRRVGQAR